MDYSASNAALWLPIIQIAIIALTILIANIVATKISFVRRLMMPTAVIGGFLLLAAKLLGIVKIDQNFFEMITYHCIAIGFIALSLRVPEIGVKEREKLVGLKSGAIIVSCYMIQAIIGLVISLTLAYTFMPGLFKAAGILLPMGYGQGPGQANNIGSSYESLGFAGGRSFGLAIAAAGYISACVVGVIYLNVLAKKGKIKSRDEQQSETKVTIDMFQGENEFPISDSLDRFSIQTLLVIAIYGATYFITWAITTALSNNAPGVANMVNSLLWGFNFMIGSGLAILTRVILKKLREAKVVNRQYQNNYLLSRLSGLAFDVMIVTGLATIEPEDLTKTWLPFVLMVVAGAVATLIHLQHVCKKVYKDYYYEGLISMYGMMTGTISSGVLLLREVDPLLKTPASNNLVIGSSFAILLAVPQLILVGMIPQSVTMTFVGLGIIVVYYFFLLGIISIGSKKKAEQ